MNRRNGLLAFLCTAVAVVTAILQVEVATGMEDLAQLFADKGAGTPPPLAQIFTPPTAPKLPTGAGGVELLTLFTLQREHRIDSELLELAKKHRLPFEVLKAHLAVSCQGVLGEEGHFWARLAEGDDRVQDDGPSRTRAATELLARYRDETGSLHGALAAWKVGVERAGRAIPKSKKPDVGQSLEFIRWRMLALYRGEARQQMCTVLGLAEALKAQWPVWDRDIVQQEGAGVRLASSPGEQVRAALGGRVGYTGQDGPRGLCIEVVSACDLHTEICDLKSVQAERGQRVEPGHPLGIAGQSRPRLNLWLGSLPIEVTQLLPPEKPIVDQGEP